LTKVPQELRDRISAGPCLNLESRTPICVTRSAASMQLLPVPSL
jgi:hypothetical protein